MNMNPSPAKSNKPAFLITIDTEGDNLWSALPTITTRNADFLPRFQALCESYGLKPTYLTSYEMASSAAFVEFGRDVLRRGVGEIGMHLHAWNTPPLQPLSGADARSHPYLIEYPEPVMRGKIAAMTDLLEKTFGVKMVSHRAGRWSLNETYARILVEKGYRVDCSVTPHVSWKSEPGGSPQSGGADYSRFPDDAYFLDLDDIRRPGDSPLLELPMTIVPARRPLLDRLRPIGAKSRFLRRALNYLFPKVHWLRPNGRNRKVLLEIVEWTVRNERSYCEFMLHSSELMPGGSPRFPRARNVEALYEDLQALFAAVRGRFVGMTLKEYHGQRVIPRP